MKSQGLVELFSQVEQLKADIARLRGQIEVLTYEQEQTQKRQRDLYVDLDSRLRKLEGGPAPTRRSRCAAPAAAPPPPVAAASRRRRRSRRGRRRRPRRRGANEQRAYDTALDQFKAATIRPRSRASTAFVKTYPKSPLAPSAQYWIGNAQFAQKDYRAAIATQRQLIAAYPGQPEGARRAAQHRDRAVRAGRRARRRGARSRS